MCDIRKSDNLMDILIIKINFSLNQISESTVVLSM